MATNPNIPSTWYEYDFPLKEIEKAPKPSNANYEPQNVAWLVEFFASILGSSSISTIFTSKIYDELLFHYENNTPNDPNDDIYVGHPLDKTYIYEYTEKRKEKSYDLLIYELYAKRSARLILFEENSPANIQYFQDI